MQGHGAYAPTAGAWWGRQAGSVKTVLTGLVTKGLKRLGRAVSQTPRPLEPPLPDSLGSALTGLVGVEVLGARDVGGHLGLAVPRVLGQQAHHLGVRLAQLGAVDVDVGGLRGGGAEGVCPFRPRPALCPARTTQSLALAARRPASPAASSMAASPNALPTHTVDTGGCGQHGAGAGG